MLAKSVPQNQARAAPATEDCDSPPSQCHSKRHPIRHAFGKGQCKAVRTQRFSVWLSSQQLIEPHEKGLETGECSHERDRA